jgi:CubicO group peptidase (beta-lactamase class C family)
MIVDAVDTYIQSAFQRHHIAGLTLAVLQNGVVIKQQAYVVASLELNVPMTVTTRYNIGALTKMFTGAAIMTLIEAGHLVFTDQIGTLLPTLPAPRHEITIYHLLTHTAGLPDLADPVAGTFIAETREEAFQLLATRPLLSQPGENWRYIQTGYVLLGMIIETLTGLAFDAFLRQQFFIPLGMSATCFGDSREIVAGRTSLYTCLEKCDNALIPRSDHLWTFQYHCPAYAYPCAGLNSTVGDLLKWDAALSAGRILPLEKLAKMWTPVRLNDGRPGGIVGTSFGYGCGWVVVDRPGHPWVGHEGGGATVYGRFLQDQLSIVVLTNCRGAEPILLLEGVAAQYLATFTGIGHGRAL